MTGPGGGRRPGRAADRRRGGELRVLLAPRTVGSTSGFMGVATLLPGERIAEHYHPYSEEFLYVVRGDDHRRPGRRAVPLGRRRGAVHPGQRAAPVAQRRRTSRPRWSSTWARWRPARSSATSTPRARAAADVPARPRRPCRTGGDLAMTGRRDAWSPGSAWSPPAGPTRDQFWDAHRGAHRDPPDHPLRPVAVPLPDRRRVRLRPGRRRADPARAAARRPVRPVRAGRRRRGGRRQRAGPRRRRPRSGPGWCSAPRSAAPPRWSTTTCVASDARRGSGWSTTTAAARYLYQALVPSSLAAEVACRHGAHGPAQVVSTGCTSGIDADRLRLPARSPTARRTSCSPAPPTRRSPRSRSPASTRSRRPRPTTTTRRTPPGRSTPDRDGFVLGEGAAVLVLEELEHARRRGAHVYCEVAGYATRSNAYHMTGLRPDGVEMAEAITDALDQARLDPSDVDYVNAHGSGTQQNDRHETAAFKRSLGEPAYRVPISSIKSMVGHSLGAIGAIEMAACALAIEHGVVPPTANWATRDPECDLDYVPNDGPGAAGRRGAVGGQRVRRLPVRDAVPPAAGVTAMTGGAPGPTRRSSGDGVGVPVVTGIGVVAPTGIGVGRALEDRCWPARRRIGRITLFDPDRYADHARRRGARASTPTQYADSRLTVQTDRWTHLGVRRHPAGARRRRAARAWPTTRTSSAVDPGQLVRAATCSASGSCSGCGASRPARSAPTSRSPGSTRPASGRSPSTTSSRGRAGCWSPSGAAGWTAWPTRRALIRRGHPGGARRRHRGPLSPYALACQLRTGLLSDRHRPGAGLPAVRRRPPRGYVPGEGGAVFVVEDLRTPCDRGAPVIYGEIAGWAATHDAAAHRRPGRRPATPASTPRAMRLALDRGRGRAPDEVDVVFPDALGVPRVRPRRGAARCARCSAPASPPVTTQKPLTGRALPGRVGAGRGHRAAGPAARRCCPPPPGRTDPAPGCELDFVRGPRRRAAATRAGLRARLRRVQQRAGAPPGVRAVRQFQAPQ